MCRLNKLMLILCVLFLFWVVQRREAWSALESEEKVPRGRTVQSESRMMIFSAHWKLNTHRSKNTKKLKRENVQSSHRWSILEQLSNIRGVSRATRTEHVYIFNRTVRSSGLKYGYGSLTFFSREWQMRMAGAPHHTNPRSATLDFWRKTTPYEQYKIIQARVPMTKWCAAHITGPW